MPPGYRTLLRTALELQSAALLAACDATGRAVAAAAGGQSATGLGRIGGLRFLAELDRARGRRAIPSDGASPGAMPARSGRDPATG